jgi:dTDP-4-dehydrorhamnose reductase
MKILLLGKNGQVGWELQRALIPLGELIAVDRTQADLAEPEKLRALIADIKPDWIINAAAYTAVDKAEKQSELAHTINAQAVGVLAEEALRQNAWLVHYSTDYVYDGCKVGAYLETDEVSPLSVYGQSKLAGEQLIRDSGCKHIIYRTSWVFAARGSNFAKSMLKLATEHEQLNVIADQFGAPTAAELIADITSLCVNQLSHGDATFCQQRVGTYHLVASGEATWHSYAKHVINKAAVLGKNMLTTTDKVLPIPTSQYPLPAKRPKNSILSTAKLTDSFKLNLPHWSSHVDRMLEEII